MIEQNEWRFRHDRFRERRKLLFLTQKELAKFLKITQVTICEYETGKAIPSLKKLPYIAVALNTSVDYLLGLTDNPHSTFFSDSISKTERDLLEAFYSLPPEKRERAVGILIGLGEE